MHRGERQVVTGLVVNEKLRPTKDFCRRLSRDVARLNASSPPQLWQRTRGQIAHLARFDPRQAQRLQAQLRHLPHERAGHKETAHAPLAVGPNAAP